MVAVVSRAFSVSLEVMWTTSILSFAAQLVEREEKKNARKILIQGGAIETEGLPTKPLKGNVLLELL